MLCFTETSKIPSAEQPLRHQGDNTCPRYTVTAPRQGTFLLPVSYEKGVYKYQYENGFILLRTVRSNKPITLSTGDDAGRGNWDVVAVITLKCYVTGETPCTLVLHRTTAQHFLVQCKVLLKTCVCASCLPARWCKMTSKPEAPESHLILRCDITAWEKHAGRAHRATEMQSRETHGTLTDCPLCPFLLLILKSGTKATPVMNTEWNRKVFGE